MDRSGKVSVTSVAGGHCTSHLRTGTELNRTHFLLQKVNSPLHSRAADKFHFSGVVTTWAINLAFHSPTYQVYCNHK